MLNLELRLLDKAPIKKELRFSPHMQIEACINKFLKKCNKFEDSGDEFSPEKIMKYFYFNGNEINKKNFFRDYNFQNGDTIIVSDYIINIPKKRKIPTRLKIKDTDNNNLLTEKKLFYKEFVSTKRRFISKCHRTDEI